MCDVWCMQIGLRQVSLETVEWFDTACKGGELTRTALARELCERESWRGPSGRPCLVSARRMLPPLAEAPGVPLPEAETPVPDPHMRSPSDFPDSSVACAPCDSPPPGSDGRDPSSRGMAAPAGRTAPILDPFGVAWDPRRHRLRGGRDAAGAADARVADIGQVVHDNRFLLLPGVRVHGLASEALRMATARVADDRETGYGVRPVLAQTFTGPGMSGPNCWAAGGPAARPATGSRLVGNPALRRGMGGTGVRPQPAPRRPGQAADCGDGRGLDPAPRRAPAGALPGPGGPGGLPTAVERGGDDGARAGVAFRADGGAVPRRAAGAGHPGHDNAEP